MNIHLFTSIVQISHSNQQYMDGKGEGEGGREREGERMEREME